MSKAKLDKSHKQGKHKQQNELAKHLKMMFSPSTTIVFTLLIIMLSLIVIGAVSTIFHLYENPISRDITIALYTGIVASGFVSITLELSKNYTSNNKALLLLVDYYLALAQFGQYRMAFPKEDDMDETSSEYSLVFELFSYQNALKELLNISDIEKTYLNEKEILYLKAIEKNVFVNKLLSEDGSQDEITEADIVEYNELIKAFSILEKEMLKKPYYGSLVFNCEQ